MWEKDDCYYRNLMTYQSIYMDCIYISVCMCIYISAQAVQSFLEDEKYTEEHMILGEKLVSRGGQTCK